jgi:copper(I)-binding protein
VRPFVYFAFVGTLLFSLSGSAGATTTQLSLSSATVTATQKSGESALSLTFTNHGDAPLSILSITSPDASMVMLSNTSSMMSTTTEIHWLSNVYVPAHGTLTLGYHNDGAILMGFTSPLRVGGKVPLLITWSSFSSPHTVHADASVVSPPQNLHFSMSSMAGLSM